jgi:tetratricopeptide (TPR) repeat protein
MKHLISLLLLVTFTMHSQEGREEKDLKSIRADREETIGASQHQTLLDSANYFKKISIEKSIDFITRSIAGLGNRADKKQLAGSLTMLGEVYQYHNQLDLAIASYQDALAAHKTMATALLLGKAFILNANYVAAESLLKPLLEQKTWIPYQQVAVFELLGDAYLGLGQTSEAVAYYEQGLKIAQLHRIAPKMADLNSKIADAYAKEGKSVEAEGFYGNSLKLAASQPPQRSIQEKEKVADFYNKKSRYPEEIDLRKKSLDELQKIEKPASTGAAIETGSDTITAQQINFKIAKAYIAQQRMEEAIPYLERSITEADADDDLVVQKDATRKLSEVYALKGDYTNALKTYQAYVSVVDTLYVRKEQEIMRAARFNREIAAKQSRIEGLEQERELSQSKYDLALAEQRLAFESNKRQQWIIYSLILGLLLMGLAVFFFYRSNRQQKLANNLLALKSLRTQMNPHFIFNALNSVNSYIAKNDERSANRYLSDFSGLMRAVLENSEEDFIPLTKELELLELYLKLEHSRFPEKFDYKIRIDDKAMVNDYQIPPMLLQPYIENAIWHGLRYREEKGWLQVDLAPMNGGSLKITISDDGIGRSKSAQLKTENQKNQKSKAMGIIGKRISILNRMHKDKVEVSIADLESDGSGTKVTLILRKD